jgi:hypothetical protein
MSRVLQIYNLIKRPQEGAASKQAASAVAKEEVR